VSHIFPALLQDHPLTITIIPVEAEAALAKSGFAPEIFRHDEEKYTHFDLDMADYKQSAFSPTSPSMKYEVPPPTYLAQPLPHGQTGTMATKGRQVNALEAPLRVPRLVERKTGVSIQPSQRYIIKPGEAF
jgi:hypothetical protein